MLYIRLGNKIYDFIDSIVADIHRHSHYILEEPKDSHSAEMLYWVNRRHNCKGRSHIFLFLGNTSTVYLVYFEIPQIFFGFRFFCEISIFSAFSFLIFLDQKEYYYIRNAFLSSHTGRKLALEKLSANCWKVRARKKLRACHTIM